jgi:hypothetical protein
MRDQFQHDIVHPWQPGRGALQKVRQLAAIATRQMPPRHLDLLFNQVEVVKQPLGGRADPPIRSNGQSNPIKGTETLLVGIQTAQERVSRLLAGDLVRRRQQAGMARELFRRE